MFGYPPDLGQKVQLYLLSLKSRLGIFDGIWLEIAPPLSFFLPWPSESSMSIFDLNMIAWEHFSRSMMLVTVTLAGKRATTWCLFAFTAQPLLIQFYCFKDKNNFTCSPFSISPKKVWKMKCFYQKKCLQSRATLISDQGYVIGFSDQGHGDIKQSWQANFQVMFPV